MSKVRTDYAIGKKNGKEVINELFHIVEHGKSEWKWVQTIEGVQREFLTSKSEKNMQKKMREWDFNFERVRNVYQERRRDCANSTGSARRKVL